jgi:dipeptidyl aminopeptidase/acylaminoacyl peptidase
MPSVHRTLLALALTSQGLMAAYAQQPTLVRDGVALSDPQIAAELLPYLSSPSVQFADWLADGSMLVTTHADGDRAQVGHLVPVGPPSAPASLEPPTSPSVTAQPAHPIEQVSFAPVGVAAAAARPYTSDAFAYVTSAADAGTDTSASATGPSASAATAASARLYLQTLGAQARLLATTRLDVGAPAWAHDGKRIAYMGAGDSGVYVLDTATSGAGPQLVTATAGAQWRVLGWSIDDAVLLLGRAPSDPLTVTPSVAGSTVGPAADPEDPVQPLTAIGTSPVAPFVDAEVGLYLADVHSGAVVPVPAPGARRAAQSLAARLALNSGQSTRDQPLPAMAITARFASDGHAILLLTRALCDRGHDASVTHEFLHVCYTDPTAGEWRQLSAPIANDVELFDESPDGRYLAYALNDAGASRLMLTDQHLKLDSAVTSLPPGVISTLKFDPLGKHLAVTFESARTAPGVYVLDLSTHALARWTDEAASRPEAAAFVAPQRVQFPTWDEIDGEPRELSAWLYRPSALAPGAAGARPVVLWLCGGGGQQCRPGYNPFVQYLLQQHYAVLAPNVRGSSGFGASFEAAGAGTLRDDAVRDVGSLLVWIGLQPGLDASRVALLGEGYGSYLALASLAEFGDRLLGAVAAFPRRFWPLQNALAIRRPVLLVQGLADPDVPGYQAAQLREGLRASGVAVQYLAAGDEAGRFTRRSNREAYDEAAASFLARLLH